MARAWPEPKDPDETLDYGVNWSAALAGDIIASSSWSLPPGISGVPSHSDTTVSIRLAGGTDGVDYGLVNTIQTLIGRIFRQTARLNCFM